MNKIKFAKNTIVTFNTLFVFIGIVASIILFISGIMIIYKVQLQDEIVPDVSGPVSRFIADVDFKSRTVSLDATITKTVDADQKIAIWRMGDGKVTKSVGIEDIADHEVTTYTYEEPGTYQIGYSVIDSNDLSDEAFCTITFESPETEEQAETEEEHSNIYNQGYANKNLVSDECGKSYTGYNNDGGVFTLNESRSQIRQSLFIIGISVVTLVFTIVIHQLIKRLFANQLATSEQK